jgi:hypothetical protein
MLLSVGMIRTVGNAICNFPYFIQNANSKLIMGDNIFTPPSSFSQYPKFPHQQVRVNPLNSYIAHCLIKRYTGQGSAQFKGY